MAERPSRSKRPDRWMMKCQACEGTGTEHHSGNIIPGWCSLCGGRGMLTLSEWEEVEQSLIDERADEEADWRQANGPR